MRRTGCSCARRVFAGALVLSLAAVSPPRTGSQTVPRARSIRLDPKNPHYFLFAAAPSRSLPAASTTAPCSTRTLASGNIWQPSLLTDSTTREFSAAATSRYLRSRSASGATIWLRPGRFIAPRGAQRYARMLASSACHPSEIPGAVFPGRSAAGLSHGSSRSRCRRARSLKPSGRICHLS